MELKLQAPNNRNGHDIPSWVYVLQDDAGDFSYPKLSRHALETQTLSNNGQRF